MFCISTGEEPNVYYLLRSENNDNLVLVSSLAQVVKQLYTKL